MYTGNFFFKIPDDHNPPFPPKSLNVHREDMDLEVRWVCPLVEKKESQHLSPVGLSFNV